MDLYEQELVDTYSHYEWMDTQVVEELQSSLQTEEDNSVDYSPTIISLEDIPQTEEDISSGYSPAIIPLEDIPILNIGATSQWVTTRYTPTVFIREEDFDEDWYYGRVPSPCDDTYEPSAFSDSVD